MSRYIQKTEFTCIVTYPTDKHPLKGRGLDMGLLKKEPSHDIGITSRLAGRPGQGRDTP